MNSFFIDKLTMYQNHDQLVKIVGASTFLHVDMETGAISERPLVKMGKYEGSYSSSLLIRSDGHQVMVTGNPSRWNRIDNLFGLQTIDECVNVYNSVLESVGLPSFTKKTNAPQYNNAGKMVTNGAVITHIDWTRNHSVGNGNEQAFICGLSTQTINRSVKPYMYPNKNTVEWYSKNVQGRGSSFRYAKVYAKVSEMIQHIKKRLNRQDVHTIDYFNQLIQFCIDTGVVREEHSFKSKFLIEHNLNHYGVVIEDDFAEYLTCIEEAMNRLQVNEMNIESMSDTLLNEGIVKSRQAANATELWYMHWLHGRQLDKQSSQYYIHNARLKQLGIDISIDLDISRAPIRLKEAQIIEVKPLEVPSWYKMPQLQAASNVVNLFKAA